MYKQLYSFVLYVFVVEFYCFHSFNTIICLFICLFYLYLNFHKGRDTLNIISQLTYFEVESKPVSFTPLCELFNNVLVCPASVNVISLVGLSRDGSGGRGR